MKTVEQIREKSQIDLVKQILKKNGTRNYLLFLLGINSGLRISDILKLKICNVKDKNYIEINEQKTGKFKRLPIYAVIKDVLNEYTHNKKEEDWLFPTQRGDKAISRVQAYRIINNACLEAGIKARIVTHTLRKTFGYHFYQKNKDIALLKTY